MNLDPSLFEGAGGSGEMSQDSVAALQKALEAGYGTDMSTLTGGAALRVQSLESTMLATIQENRHFALFNQLQKTKAIATVDEWTEQSGIGGFLGGSTNSETGNIPEATGTYNRRVGQVKYLMTRRQVSFVQTLQSAIADAEATEYQAGALQLLSDAEFLSFEGDSTVVPTEFDGLSRIITDLNSADHVLDAEGNSLASISLIATAAANIAGFGNYGTPTDIFWSMKTQADMDVSLDPAFRVPLTDVAEGGLRIGAPVIGIRTSQGNIATRQDVFIRDEAQQRPFELDSASQAALNTFASAGVAGVAGAGGADSKWGAAHAGNYYYAVAGTNSKGQSVVVKSAQVAVAAGQQVTVTIQPSVSGLETGYVIYRGRKNGTNATDDFRVMTRVPKALSGNTVYVDKNRELPGTSKAYILNLSPGALAVTWRQLLPMMKFPLYPTVAATVPWAQLLFGFLRVGKRRHNVVIKNIVPSSAAWKPFV